MTATADPAALRAARWLAAWDGLGIHRTGTAGDAAGAAWLAREAAVIGAEADSEEFAFDRLDPIAAAVELDGDRIPGVPVFDAPSTGPHGIIGRLGQADGEAEIAVVTLPPQSVYSGKFQALRRRSAARGLVIACAGTSPGLALLNAEQFREPYGVPAIHVGSEYADRLFAAAAQGAEVRMISHSRRSGAVAHNNVALLPGDDPDRASLIVMTPRSSWWQSTAERGGGIVCWLECLRSLIADRRGRPVVFTANSGHELGHLGLDDFVARRPGCEESAIWLHWGANLGAAGGALTVMSASDDLRELAASELTSAGQNFTLAPKTIVPSGETRDIHRKGGRYLTLVGSNKLFHQPEDRWPQAVELNAVVRIARAAAAIARNLARR